jgi:hypothetical protein
MKERKKNIGWQNDTEKLKKRDQVEVNRLRTGYSTATHRNKFEGTSDPNCPVCSAKLTLEHILDERSMEQRNKNAGRVCEKHQIIPQTITTKPQIGKKKEQTRNDERNCKWTRKRIRMVTNEN